MELDFTPIFGPPSPVRNFLAYASLIYYLVVIYVLFSPQLSNAVQIILSYLPIYTTILMVAFAWRYQENMTDVVSNGLENLWYMISGNRSGRSLADVTREHRKTKIMGKPKERSKPLRQTQSAPSLMSTPNDDISRAHTSIPQPHGSPKDQSNIRRRKEHKSKPPAFSSHPKQSNSKYSPSNSVIG